MCPVGKCTDAHIFKVYKEVTVFPTLLIFFLILWWEKNRVGIWLPLILSLMVSELCINPSRPEVFDIP